MRILAINLVSCISFILCTFATAQNQTYFGPTAADNARRISEMEDRARFEEMANHHRANRDDSGESSSAPTYRGSSTYYPRTGTPQRGQTGFSQRNGTPRRGQTGFSEYPSREQILYQQSLDEREAELREKQDARWYIEKYGQRYHDYVDNMDPKADGFEAVLRRFDVEAKTIPGLSHKIENKRAERKEWLELIRAKQVKLEAREAFEAREAIEARAAIEALDDLAVKSLSLREQRLYLQAKLRGDQNTINDLVDKGYAKLDQNHKSNSVKDKDAAADLASFLDGGWVESHNGDSNAVRVFDGDKMIDYWRGVTTISECTLKNGVLTILQEDGKWWKLNIDTNNPDVMQGVNKAGTKLTFERLKE